MITHNQIHARLVEASERASWDEGSQILHLTNFLQSMADADAGPILDMWEGYLRRLVLRKGEKGSDKSSFLDKGS